MRIQSGRPDTPSPPNAAACGQSRLFLGPFPATHRTVRPPFPPDPFDWGAVDGLALLPPSPPDDAPPDPPASPPPDRRHTIIITDYTAAPPLGPGLAEHTVFEEYGAAPPSPPQDVPKPLTASVVSSHVLAVPQHPPSPRTPHSSPRVPATAPNQPVFRDFYQSLPRRKKDSVSSLFGPQPDTPRAQRQSVTFSRRATQTAFVTEKFFARVESPGPKEPPR